MQQNCLNPIPNKGFIPQQLNPNAVNINIFSPKAYSDAPNCNNMQNGYYSMYGQNTQPAFSYYPPNYNNMIQQPAANSTSALNALNETNLVNKTNSENVDESKTEEKENKKKTKIIPLTDDYIKSLENYLNSDNSKIRLIGAKELMQRFKEDENRKDNPSLIPLLNKSLRDTSPAVRFLALTSLQLGYTVGNDETISLLKEIAATNKDKLGEDSLLASEILLKLSAPQAIEVDKG